MGKKASALGKGKGKGKRSSLSLIGIFAVLAGLVYLGTTFYFKSRFAPEPTGRPTSERSNRRRAQPQPPNDERVASASAYKTSTKKAEPAAASKHGAPEWEMLPRDMDACLASQEELMTIPVPWPGFHALCIDSVGSVLPLSSMSVLLHPRSGRPENAVGTRTMRVWDDGSSSAPQPVLETLVKQLQDELLPYEFQQVDPMVSTSLYDFPPNPWRLYTQRGNLIETDADLANMGRGAAVWLYTGGQFIWPGVRIGHKHEVPIPLVGGGYKMVELITRSLRPVVLEVRARRSPSHAARLAAPLRTPLRIMARVRAPRAERAPLAPPLSSPVSSPTRSATSSATTPRRAWSSRGWQQWTRTVLAGTTRARPRKRSWSVTARRRSEPSRRARTT